MTQYFVKNILGFKPNDEQMKDVPYPLTELVIHVTEKTVQTGCLIGGFIIPPVVHIFTRKTSLVSKVSRYGAVGIVVGLVAGYPLTMMQLKNAKADEAAIYDRSYRLRYNVTQLNVDRAAFLGAVLGFAATRNCLGLVVGLNSGTLGAAIYNNTVVKTNPKPPKKEKMEEEKKKEEEKKTT